MLALFVWLVIATSLVLTLASVELRSWRLLAGATVLSFAFSLLALFSIGPLLFLLTCLQGAAALSLARGWSVRGWSAALASAFSAWMALVALPLSMFWF